MDWLAIMFQRGNHPDSRLRPCGPQMNPPSRGNQIVDLLMTADRLASTVAAAVRRRPACHLQGPGSKDATLKRQVRGRSRPDSPDTDSVGQTDSRAAAQRTHTGRTGHTRAISRLARLPRLIGRSVSANQGPPFVGTKEEKSCRGQQHGLEAAHSRCPVLHISPAYWT